MALILQLFKETESNIIDLKSQEYANFFDFFKYFLNRFLKKGFFFKFNKKFYKFLLLWKFSLLLDFNDIFYIALYNLYTKCELKVIKKKFKRDRNRITIHQTRKSCLQAGIKNWTTFLFTKEFKNFIDYFFLELIAVYFYKSAIIKVKYEVYHACLKIMLKKKKK